ncbi:hypothetical protein ACA910_000774 [Epithemia clementina (nom. ined.)]
MDSESHLGLGYYHHQRQQGVRNHRDGRNKENGHGRDDVGVDTTPKHDDHNDAAGVVENIEEYMNQYLQQCLKYHDEQGALRRQHQQRAFVDSELPPSSEQSTSQLQHVTEQQQYYGEKEAINFISTGVGEVKHEENLSADQSTAQLNGEKDVAGNSAPSNINKESDQVPAGTSSASTSATNVELAAAEGRRRAQAILLRFQQQQEQLLFNQNLAPSTNYKQESQQPQQVQEQLAPYHVPEEPPEPLVFLEQRRRGMQREIMIRKHALLKNLEYVAEKERLRSQTLQNDIAQARQLEEQAKAQYEAATLRRKQRINESLSTQAGIGTKQRKEAERIKVKEGHVPLKSNKDDPSTVAVYISGLPKDGSLTSDAVKDLFGCYGNIVKVHFYLNKTTGEVKGDGLVIYSFRGDENEGSNLVNMVCSQMSGAVLPSGDVLKVEPSSSNKKSAGSNSATVETSSSNEKQMGSNSAVISQTPSTQHDVNVQHNGEDGNDDELDDFFSSI